jgi:AcrR family transcriptional regulator
MSTTSDLSETQETILNAAMSCIMREGIDGTSLRDVAREAEVSLGLLSYHFDDRRALIVAAFELATARLLAASLDSLVGIDGAEERVRAFVRGSFHGQFLEPEYLALRVALWAISRTDDQIEAVEKRNYARYKNKLAKLITSARPAIKAGLAAQRATDVIALQNGLWLNWARYANRADLDRGLDLCDRIALAPVS